MDNGIKTVQSPITPTVTPAAPKRIPPPAFVDNGRPLAKNDHGPVTNLHKVSTDAETELQTLPPQTTTDTSAATDEAAAAAAERKQRREEWSMAEKARQLEASANEKLKKAAAYESAVANFNKDPLALAKILGVSVPELLDKMQRAAFSMPTEKVLSAEEQYKLKVMQYEQEVQQVKQQQILLNNQIIKENMVNKKILPELVKNPDKYEILHSEGIDGAASFIFDYIADEYHRTGKELDPADVAASMEEELAETYRSNANRLKNVKKFKDIFAAQAAADEKTEAAVEVAKTIPAAKVEVSANETDLAKLIPRSPAKKVSVQSSDSGPDNTISKGTSREDRLARLRAARGENS